mgnify:CR=1 FL=1
MKWFFLIFIGIVLIQRFIELYIAKQNAQWMEERGGVEFSAGHYPFIVFVHVLFFVSMIVEVFAFDRSLPSWWGLPFFIFVGAQVLRWWCIRSLGRFWNTRIIVVPHAPVVRRGPYRYLRHPNYVVVMLELLSFPLIFGAIMTALIVSMLNFIVLRFIRIPAEERALSAMTDYS